MASSMTDAVVKAAIAAVESESATVLEKIEMLIELAHGLQQKPKNAEPLWQAVELYRYAIDLSQDYPLQRARAQAGMGTALRSIPDEGSEFLQQARDCYQAALPVLQEQAAPEEVAETEMNLGLVLQSLVPFNQARLVDSIQAYQRALWVFTGNAYPQEFAILQNNIAIAYLSMPLSAGAEDMRQGMAVQSFQQALKWVSLIDHPSEYAMLQNNLGNALQYLPSTHPIDNNLRALTAYEEALKVRTVHNTPLEYANTIANKANVLLNLPDDLKHPEDGNRNNQQQAQGLLQEATTIFQQYGQWQQVDAIRQTLDEIATGQTESPT